MQEQTQRSSMQARHPNIVIVTTHDSGRHFGCYGVPTVRTPNIDRLAAEGVCFDNVNAACPICSPSRGALLTGQYPQTNGLVGLAGGVWNWELHDYRAHLSHRLREQGYETAMFGLQHETKFVERMGFERTQSHGVKRGGREIPASEVAADFASFLADRDGKRPFYAQVGFFETHTRYDFGGCQPDEKLGVWMPPYAKTHDWPSWAAVLNRFGSDPAFAREHLAELQGALHEADRGMGAVLEALGRHGLANDTLVVFNTDHGPELPGAKWTMYDRGLGIAFIMRWPGGGIQGGRRNDWLLGNVDFLPTLYELIGLRSPEGLQGVSFAQGCTRETAGEPSPRQVAFGNWVDGLNFSARTDRYKLIRNLVPVDSTGRECEPYELYDLALDPLELTDVTREPAYAEAFAEMKAHLDAHLATVDDPVVHHAIQGEHHNDMIADYRAKYEASRN
jgi:arylsulfatase A-like enzyme